MRVRQNGARTSAEHAGSPPGNIVVSVDGVSVEKLGIEAVYTPIIARSRGARVAIGLERNGSRVVRTLATASFEPRAR